MGVAAGLVLGIAVYTAWWWFLAERLRTGIEDWRAERIEDGIDVAWSSLAIDGFPATVRATVAAPRVAIPEAWRWESGELILGLEALNPAALTIQARGRHVVDVIRDGGAENIELDAERLDGRVARVADALSVTLGLDDVEVRKAGELQGRIEDMTLHLRQFDPPAESDPQALTPPVVFQMALTMTTEMTDPPADWPFKDRASHIVLDSRILGDVDVPLNRARLAAWRDLGGVLEIDRFRLELGNLAFSGDGTVSLDGALQPVGALSVRLQGFEKLIDALVISGQLAAKDAGIIKGVLNLVAKIDPGSGENVIDAAFTVQNRKLYLGPFELLKLRPIVWPD